MLKKLFAKLALRIDPALGKVWGYIPGTVDPNKPQAEKDITAYFMVMMISWLVVASKNGTKPVIIKDGDTPEYEITFKKL